LPEASWQKPDIVLYSDSARPSALVITKDSDMVFLLCSSGSKKALLSYSKSPVLNLYESLAFFSDFLV